MPDSDPNVGIGVPIVGGVAGTGSIVEPLPYTLLSLPRFAKLLGINPVHFQGAVGDNIFPLKNNACSDIWPQYSWQYSDAVSRYDLAYAIAGVEQDIAEVLNYHPAPRWISNEMHRYPSMYRPQLTEYGGRQFTTGLRKTIKTRWGKFIGGGIRGTTSIGTATTGGGSLVYLDNDGDGFAETARITLTTTATTDPREVKVYHTGQNADQRWEIRPLNSVTFTGSTVVIYLDSWLLIDPELQGAHPDWSVGGFQAINVTTTSNYVASVDVYREYTDRTVAQSQFYWEPTGESICTGCAVQLEGGDFVLLETGGDVTSSCPTCGMYVQDGCLMIRDVETGIVAPAPAEYDIDSDAQVIQTWAIEREPDMVKVWYRAGDIDEYYLRGTGLDPLSNFWAQAIAYMAVARLDRPFCSCANVTSLAQKWQTDLALNARDFNFSIDFNLLANPFGTRAGEVFAWSRVAKLGKIQYEGVVI